ncbi:MAG: mandelate racemase [bacterium]|nr:mandelate racemase [bacterium]
MKIKNIEVFPIQLKYKTEFKISRGSVGSPRVKAPHIFVKITTDSGLIGWGEARPSHRWSYETEESVVTTLKNYLTPALLGVDIRNIERIHQIMAQEIAPGFNIGQPIAKSAIDIAIYDILSKNEKKSLRDYLHQSDIDTIPLSYMVSVTSPEVAYEQARQAYHQGYRGFKIKIGIEPKKDIEIVSAVKSVGNQAYLWVDGNQAYTVQQAISLARQLEKIGIDVFEQPVAANNLFGLQEVVNNVGIPIAVDESVYSPMDLIQLIRLQALTMVVMKVSKMGGLFYAQECIRIARDAGIGLLGSGLTETRFGLVVSAQLYAAYGITLPVDLNGPQFLAEDVVKSNQVSIENGKVILPQRIGIGVELNPEKFLSQ